MFKRSKLFKYQAISYGLTNIISEEKDLISNPPFGKIVAYEAAKKILLPNAYWQIKLYNWDNFFVGSTIGFDFKKFPYKYFEIGTGTLRLDIVNSIFDIILYKLKSDVTEYRYGLLYRNEGFKGLMEASVLTNLFLTTGYLKVLFFKINFCEVSVGNLISLIITNAGLWGTELQNESQEKRNTLARISLTTFLISVLVPSLHIDIKRFIDFIKYKKVTFIDEDNIGNVDNMTNTDNDNDDN